MRTVLEPNVLISAFLRGARMEDDPDAAPSVRSPDSGDDYLIALAQNAQAVIVSGDKHLLGLAERLPVFSPANFSAELDRHP